VTSLMLQTPQGPILIDAPTHQQSNLGLKFCGTCAI